MKTFKKVILAFSLLAAFFPEKTFAISLSDLTPSGFLTKVLATTTGLPAAGVSDIIFNIMDWLLGILGAVGVIAFVISGILYLTSAGDEDQAKRAKRAMTYAIIGIVVGLAGLVALKAILRLLKADTF